MDYEIVIGLEVHAQLLTRSKMFCSCDARYSDDPPNTHVCPVCLGMPGVLPVINRRAVEYTMMTALALNCSVPEHSKFDRKNYSYPDLMKGYQISQYDAPIGVKGWMDVEANGTPRRIGITRVHLEEDVARLTHASTPWGETYSLVDVNRSGVPLMEIVSEPDIRSAEEARQYLMKLRSIICCLRVCTGNMEEGSFRCDANISIRPAGSRDYLPKVEVKNLNSFKAVFQALEYEAERQKGVVEKGGVPVQETRGWLDEKGVTVSQRTKEYAHDYRYFPEPDLPPLTLSREWVEQLRAAIPELPDARRDRFVAAYGLPRYDASLLTTSRELADFFEAAASLLAGKTPDVKKQAKSVSNWLLGDFARLLNATATPLENSKVTPGHLAELIQLTNRGVITGPAAKAVFEEMFQSGKRAEALVAEKGLTQITDASAIQQAVDKAFADNPAAVADFHAGKEQALTFLMGQVMRLTRGRANPPAVREALRDRLGRGA
ncbi:MAG: Asp-tRNA(Asn)/Glu-tRNA(Gln) amidotransferase subunit GatB [Chloroflexi bacterium]|nr:Asp-tRNA(Asn)/Glu-tRNA(Gln) amidotransferase subunit GatB [Chloroflexota bacterium]